MTVERGDCVLVSFVFSDQSGAKLRPALVVSSPAYHRSRQDVILAAITSNVSRVRAGDHRVSAWKASGMLFPSLVTGIIRTVKRASIVRRLGRLPPDEMVAVDRALRGALGL